MKTLCGPDGFECISQLLGGEFPSGDATVIFGFGRILDDNRKRPGFIQHLPCRVDRSHYQIETVIAGLVVEIISSAQGGMESDFDDFFIYDFSWIDVCDRLVGGRKLNLRAFRQSNHSTFDRPLRIAFVDFGKLFLQKGWYVIRLRRI